MCPRKQVSRKRENPTDRWPAGTGLAPPPAHLTFVSLSHPIYVFIDIIHSRSKARHANMRANEPPRQVPFPCVVNTQAHRAPKTNYSFQTIYARVSISGNCTPGIPSRAVVKVMRKREREERRTRKVISHHTDGKPVTGGTRGYHSTASACVCLCHSQAADPRCQPDSSHPPSHFHTPPFTTQPTAPSQTPQTPASPGRH
jgi:hypothetical protein